MRDTDRVATANRWRLLRDELRWQLALRLASIDRDLPAERLAGWTPVWLAARGARPPVSWLDLGTARLREPFLASSARRVWRARGRPSPVRTPIERLIELRRASPGLQPAGLIFHVSRCGSTLAANMLAALAENRVVREPEALNLLLQNPDPATDERLDWLRAMAAALGQPQRRERRFILKLSSFNLLHLELFDRAFPGLPRVFLFRHPVEVAVSNLERPRGFMVARRWPRRAARLTGLEAREIRRAGAETYVVRVLERLLERIERGVDSRTLLLSYRQLRPGVAARLAEHFSIAAGGEQLAAMERALGFDAKARRRPFRADAEAKRARASRRLRELAAERALPLYERLEARAREKDKT